MTDSGMLASASFDADIACMLHMAFGRPVSAQQIPVPAGYGERGIAFWLDAPGVPRHVLLLRYAPQAYVAAQRMFTTLRALEGRGFPAPRPYYMGWTRRDRWLGLLVSYAPGNSRGSNPFPFFMRVGPAYARALADLHRMHWRVLPDVPIMPLRYIVDLLVQRGQALRTPELNTILNWLAQHIDNLQEQPHTLIHGDYLLEHIIARGSEIAYIYGWENAVLADPRFDVGLASAALSVYDLTLSNQFVEAYTAAAGPVDDLVIWEVLNALRILTRIATSLSTLHAEQRARLQERVIPVWDELLAFIEARTGLRLRHL